MARHAVIETVQRQGVIKTAVIEAKVVPKKPASLPRSKLRFTQANLQPWTIDQLHVICKGKLNCREQCSKFQVIGTAK